MNSKELSLPVKQVMIGLKNQNKPLTELNKVQYNGFNSLVDNKKNKILELLNMCIII